MLMRVTILRGGNRCKDYAGNIYSINCLVVEREITKEKVIYTKDTRLFQLVCSEGLSWDAMLLDSGKVNIY